MHIRRALIALCILDSLRLPLSSWHHENFRSRDRLRPVLRLHRLLHESRSIRIPVAFLILEAIRVLELFIAFCLLDQQVSIRVEGGLFVRDLEDIILAHGAVTVVSIL